MSTWDEIIKRDDVRASWFYTHSESGQDHGGTDAHDYDVYDVVFSRDNGVCLYGGRMNRLHVLMRGIGQSPRLSQRNHGGRLIKPDLAETLARVIDDADEAGEYTSFPAWAREVREMNGAYAEALADLEDWQIQQRRVTELMAWLCDDYAEYVKAAHEYLADH